MSRDDYHLHGESSGGPQILEQLDYTPFEPQEGAGADYVEENQPTYHHLESRSPSDHQPNTLCWESRRAFEYDEEPISTEDNVGKADFEEHIDRQNLPPSPTRERIKRMDMDYEDINHFLTCLNCVHRPSKISEGLYVANYETAWFYFTGQGNQTKHYPKIGHVLSLIDFTYSNQDKFDNLRPIDPEEFPDGTTLLLKIKDSRRVSIMDLFPIIIEFIVKGINHGGTEAGQGKGVLVHCRKGVSRSIAAVMAYLTWAENKEVIDVWNRVVRLRIVAYPNEEFFTQLIMWVMWNRRLTNEDGGELNEYSEYLIEKGLETPLIDGIRANLTAHLNLTAPKPWPLKFWQD